MSSIKQDTSRVSQVLTFQTRPLDTQVSLSETTGGGGTGCLCFVCRHCFFSKTGGANRCAGHRKQSTPRTTTTTTIINCDKPHQNKGGETGIAPVSINLQEEGGDGNNAQQANDNPCKDKDGGEQINDEDGPTSTGTNLDDVRQNFISLVRHNKLQYFLLGTIIYSAINTLSIFNLMHGAGLLSDDNGSANNQSLRNLENHQTIDLLLVKFIFALNSIILMALLMAALIISSRDLTLVGKSKSKLGTCQSNTEYLLNIFGSIAILLVFYLQLIFHLLMIRGNSNHSSSQSMITSSDASFHWMSQELVSASLLYILPLLLEGGPMRGCLINSLASLPPLTIGFLTWFTLEIHLKQPQATQIDLVYPSIGSKSEDNKSDLLYPLLKLLSYLFVSTLFGLLRRCGFKWTVIESTFAGANQLIEAKVSLEHQRQQQETLLLSVLPAYVAAQVKRNMLKSSSTATAVGGNSPTACTNPQSSGEPSPQTVGGWPLIHSASAVVQPPTGYGVSQTRSRSVDGSSVALDPSNGGGSNKQQGSKLVTTLSINQRSRNPSFALSEMLTSRLASGAAYLSETLAPSSSVSTNHLSCPGSNHRNNNIIKSNHQSTLVQQQPTPIPIQPSPSSNQVRRGFNELYIRTYNNVSLLYGDIVGFTRLCTQLSSWQLVRVLNDLFSHFDRLAERHKIMRIKILGDCYYGVSGIPEFAVMGAKSRASRNDNHAINCVNMGLDMIQYIRRFNIERQQQLPTANQQQQQQQQQQPRKEPVIVVSSPVLSAATELSTPLSQSAVQDPVATGQNSPLPAFELNMRIGIHSGHIHSGVIGLKKWQFDVWSNDVSIAMHCESSGTAGRVQVTDATIQQLNGAFSYERGPGCDRDPFLAAKDTRTYLIKDRISPHKSTTPTLQIDGCDTVKGLGAKLTGSKRTKIISCQNSYESKGGEQLEQENNIRAATIGTIRQTLLSCDESEDGIPQAFNYLDIKPISLSFQDPAMGRLYAQRPIKNFAQEMLSFCLIVSLLYLVNQKLLIPIDCPLIITIICVLLAMLLILVTISNRPPREVVCHLDELLGPDLIPASPSASNVGSNRIADENFTFGSPNIFRRFMSRATFRLSEFCSSLSIHDDGNSLSFRKGLRLFAGVLASLAVIIFHCYTLFQQMSSFQKDHCLLLTNANAKERNEMTVILLLMLLDSSTHLISYKTKSLLFLIIIACQSTRLVIFSISDFDLCLPTEKSNTVNHWLIKQQTCAVWSSGSLLIIMILWSLFYAHQLEYTNKANFLWRNRLNVDHEELEYISGINKVLLENILPSHVVQHYLTHPSEQHHESATTRTGGDMLPGGLLTYMRMSFSNMRNNEFDSNKLYHEQHDGVAVMFASIPHFYEFYDESDISKQGLGCIALLNEIICDFDKLLLKNKFSRIEKIKTIGSTYMAAAGLRPCNLSGARNSTASQASVASSQSPRASPGLQTGARVNQLQQQQQQLPLPSSLAGGGSTCSSDPLNEGASERRLALSQQKQNLICMIQFASNLMTALNGINKQSFQVFKLRVGVNTGPVVAGVIGAQRPFYDIWGDCVNIASRMESLGEVGRIQVEEKTAKLLMESLCTETYSIVKRGPIDVKGKGGMVTYFVDRREASATSEEQQKDTSLGIDTNHQAHHLHHNRVDLQGPRGINPKAVLFDSQEVN